MTDTPGGAPASAADPSRQKITLGLDVKRPWWMFLPDTRGWVALGLFCLTAYIFALIAWKPELASNQLFAMLAQAVVISGLISGVVAFLYGASKGAADAREQVGAALAKVPDAGS